MISYDITRPCRNPRFRSWSPAYKVDCSRDIVKDNKRSQILYRKRDYSLRKVENENAFQKIYEECRFPVRLVNAGLKTGVEWLIDPANLPPNEAKAALVKFSVGLPIEKPPFGQVALKAFTDILTLEQAPMFVAESLPLIIPNIRKGLDSKRYEKRLDMLRLIRRLATLTGIGPLLVPYYRTLLSPLRMKLSSKIDLDISTRQKDRYVGEVYGTLQCLERFGGRHAFVNIKYVIPDYQRSV